jgi:hypothetical protein
MCAESALSSRRQTTVADIRERRACISAFIHVVSTSYTHTPAMVSLQRMQGLTTRFKSTTEAPCKQELYALVDTLEWAMMLIEKQLQTDEDRHQGRVAELEADKCEWEQVATELMEELAVLQTEIKCLREHGMPCSNGMVPSSGWHIAAAQEKVQLSSKPETSKQSCGVQTQEAESEFPIVNGLQAHSADSTQVNCGDAHECSQEVHWGAANAACWDHAVAAAQAACEDAKVSMRVAVTV